jgi:hypothetical protein
MRLKSLKAEISSSPRMLVTMNEFHLNLRAIAVVSAWLLVVAGFILTFPSQEGFAQQAAPQSAQPSQQQSPPPTPAAQQGARQIRRFGSGQAGCAPSFPQRPLAAGTRVLFFTSTAAVEGAQVYLNGKCQGLIRREAPNRNAYSLRVANVPPGKYSVRVQMQGYKDFRSNVNVMSSEQPPGKTPKVIVRFELQPM